eukprot:COSAG05_NODE_5243_length_1227_cov_14.937057_1_plen_20_part_10
MIGLERGAVCKPMVALAVGA